MNHKLTKTEKSQIYPRMVMKLKQTGKIHIIKPISIKGFTQHAARENWYILNQETQMWEDWESKPKFKVGDILRTTKKLGWNSYMNSMKLTVKDVKEAAPQAYYLTGEHNGEVLSFIVPENELEYYEVEK
jgi:hypothetical protein